MREMKTVSRGRITRAGVVAAVTLALWPSAAVAAGGSVHHDAATGVTTLVDGPGSARVRLSAEACAPGLGSAVCARFTSAGDPLAAGDGCIRDAAGAVVCPQADTYRIRLGGDDDRFAVASGGEAVPRGRLVVSGGAGDDIVVGGPGDDRLSGGPGRDRIVGDDPGCNWGDTHNCGGDDVVRGGAGDDVITGGRGADRLSGGRGADRIAGDEPACTWWDPRCGGADVATGGPGDDVIVGGPGADRVSGGPGSDRLAGDDPGCNWGDTHNCGGDDVMTGGAGDDLIVGGLGHDRLFGGPGHNRIVPGCNVNDPWCG
jgi:hypothetical protein